MNIAEQMDMALAPIWIIDSFDCSQLGPDLLRPGRVIPVRRIDSIRIVGGNPPDWERARRVIEGADA